MLIAGVDVIETTVLLLVVRPGVDEGDERP